MAHPHPEVIDQLYDLNEEASFRSCLSQITREDNQNFMVAFDESNSQCAVDQSNVAVEQWLSRQTINAPQTLWINIWASEFSDEIVDTIASRYNLSPRQRLLLNVKSEHRQTETHADRLSTSTASPVSSKALQNGNSGRTPAAHGDVEKAVPKATGSDLGSKTSDPASSEFLKGFGFATLVSNLWHFCSVDWGQHYLHVGFNALFPSPKPDSTDSSKPSGQRIWSALIICDDGTVISIFERPRILPDWSLQDRAKAIQITRQNVLNVFRQLSKLYRHDDKHQGLMRVQILGTGPDSASSVNALSEPKTKSLATTEWPSLLFYYLFDDWLNTYALVARKQHPYHDKLETLRRDMSDVADVKLIDSLHVIGKQLTALRLIYQSYELIVSRILNRHRLMRYPNQPILHHRSSIGADSDVNAGLDTSFSQPFGGDGESSTSVRLSFSSIARFERLLDRIRLYALTEIEECLKEKESLVLMTFNLVALKESQAVEKLTRTTILLAKATILFLPVSLMTAYFSIQVDQIQKLYSLKTYWFSFLVVSVLSILFLLVFGFTTNTLEGKTVYKSFTRTLWDKSKRSRS